MRNRLDEAKTDLLAKASAISDRSHRAQDEALLKQYYRHVAAEDLVDRDPLDIYGAATSHRSAADRRPQGTAVVNVYTPSVEEHGWSSGHTVAEVVIDDMPFLVDSVTMALSEHDHSIYLVVHPQLVVRRDITGKLLEVCDFSENDPEFADTPDAVVESWMHVEIGRIDDPKELDRINSRLLDVLRDVREAVEDWPRMRQRAEDIATELDAADLPVQADEVAEASGLLRWLADDHFTFLGYREYRLDEVDDETVLRAVTGSGLGILRSDQDLSNSFAKLPPEARVKAREKRVLVLTKANSRATVHRPAYLDYVGVKIFDDRGEVVGERRFLGLLTSSAYTESVLRIPILRQRVKQVIEQAGFGMTSHSGKDLLQVLETYPRDELLQTRVEDLLPTALAVIHLEERRQLRLFVRRDDYGRYLSVLVYLPLDRYNTDVRQRIQRILLAAAHGDSIDFAARIGESALARLHFVIRVRPGQTLPELDVPALEKQLIAAARGWSDEFADALAEKMGEGAVAPLIRRYKDAFPEGYKADFPARAAVADVRRLEELPDTDGLGMNLYRPIGGEPGERRFKIYRSGSPISLTQILPVLSRMGVEVVDERPYEILSRSNGGTRQAYIYDFGLRYDGSPSDHGERLKDLFQEGFAAVWSGAAESDGFNALIALAGLSWRQVAVLRSYASFMRQAGSTFSRAYMQRSLTSHIDIAHLLVELFATRFDPELYAADDAGQLARDEAADKITERIEVALDEVTSLDRDRILRSFLALVNGTLRTNYYQLDARGEPKTTLSFKIDSKSLRELPEPRPMVEIWVCSPRIEGVHLRYGAVARGGLRWSDRREDFRTEILGLVKAQAVKNAVIVPVGAKGGFVAKQAPDPSNREAWLAEGVECYRAYISAMLDITDNRAADQTVTPPAQVVRRDGDDPYLVVAADKGTAALSDIANEVSKSYGFWLGDAFASGGSAGYDHKAMGITARGAWESVKRHFRELGRDCQTEDFTAVGIGDMSGDVFGNGMLLSEHTRLVAAFDHRHIFLDPDPDAATSFHERRRLFDLPKSSWNDYNAELISPGGGVYPRTAKKVVITEQARQCLGIAADVVSMTPAELIRAILTAPVDLLWNGGIGTYVKASTESHADVGDKATDGVRVDAADLRCTIVGEGGNLGLTQRARIEFASNKQGGRSHHINTDAIDNSAGVDTSDHEVNIKILLDGVVRTGDLTPKQRDGVLAEMQEEVASLVLGHNYAQNVALQNGVWESPNLAHVHRAYVTRLENDGLLDRSIEGLPTDKQFAERMNAGTGLTAPELAVMMAYTKNTMYSELLETTLPDDPYLYAALHAYFPTAVRDRFHDRIAEHPLRREIVTNVVVNDLVNLAGTSFAFRLSMETGGTVEDLARAHTVASVVYQVSDAMAAIKQLDNIVDAGAQTRMRLEIRKIAERVTRWLCVNRRPPLDIAWQVGFFEEPIARLLGSLPDVLVGRELDLYQQRLAELTSDGVPADLANRIATLPPAYAGLGMVENSLTTGTDLLDVARMHFTLGEYLEIGRLLERIIALPRTDRWQTMARASLRDELHAVHASLTAQALQVTPENADPSTRVDAWVEQDDVMVARARQTLADVVQDDTADLARLSVALGVIRSLIRSPG